MTDKEKKESLRSDLREGHTGKLEEKNKGKKFLKQLDDAKDINDIATLITSIMPENVFSDRLKHVSNNPLILNFHTASLKVNIDRGYEPRHVDYVTLAIEKTSEILKNKDIAKVKENLKKSVDCKVLMMAQCRGGMSVG